MGQKTNPVGFRLGINKSWNSIWTAPTKQDYSRLLHEDLKIRDWIKKTYYNAAIEKIIIKRIMDRIFLEIHCAKIGVVIGKKAAGIERIKNFVSQVAKIPKDNI